MILKISHIFVLACFLACANAAAIPSLPKGVAGDVQSAVQNYLAQNLLNVKGVPSDFSASKDESRAIKVINTTTSDPEHYGNTGCLVFKCEVCAIKGFYLICYFSMKKNEKESDHF